MNLSHNQKKRVAGSANKMIKVKFNKRLFQCYRYLELRHAWQQCTNEECYNCSVSNHKRVCNVLDQLIIQWKAIKERKKRVPKMLLQEKKLKNSKESLWPKDPILMEINCLYSDPISQPENIHQMFIFCVFIIWHKS